MEARCEIRYVRVRSTWQQFAKASLYLLFFFFFFLLLTWLLATLVVPIALSSPSFAFVTLPPLKVLFMLPALPGQPSYEV